MYILHTYIYNTKMRVNRTYTIEVEHIERLKEYNASELLNKLLEDYFATQTDPNAEDRLAKIQKLKDDKEAEVKREIEILEKREAELQEEQKSKIQQIAKIHDKKEEFKANFFNNFRDIVGREGTVAEYQAFKVSWDNNEFTNFYDWLEDKGYIKYDRDEELLMENK